MNSLQDLVISVAIGGIVLAMLFGFNTNIAQQGSAQNIKIIAQSNLTTVTNLLEFEFKKMGYRVAKGLDSAIVYADSNKIKFKGDIDNNGTVDTLTYYLNAASPSGLQNTNTRILYRTLNSQSAKSINLGITRFRLWYSDASGNPFTSNPVSQPSLITCVKIGMNIESTVPYKVTTESYVTKNPGVYWEQIIKPKNLK
jgi:hypothetical protein